MTPHRDPASAGGYLVLAATPIGNVRDASPRLVELLESADVVAAEDTRRLRRLCAGLAVSPGGRVASYHEHNEVQRTPELIDAIERGGVVALVTDAGMPSVSDPGFRLVQACAEAGLMVTVVPGPSAVLSALALSGLPSDRFTFEGFLPRKPGERTRTLMALAEERRTMVFFESPHRTAATVAAMRVAFGADRRAAICRELTKTFEEVVRGSLEELSTWAGSRDVKGEVSLVVSGCHEVARSADLESLVSEVLQRVADGARLKDAAGEVATHSGARRKDLYDAAVAHGRL